MIQLLIIPIALAGRASIVAGSVAARLSLAAGITAGRAGVMAARTGLRAIGLGPKWVRVGRPIVARTVTMQSAAGRLAAINARAGRIPLRTVKIEQLASRFDAARIPDRIASVNRLASLSREMSERSSLAKLLALNKSPIGIAGQVSAVAYRTPGILSELATTFRDSFDDTSGGLINSIRDELSRTLPETFSRVGERIAMHTEPNGGLPDERVMESILEDELLRAGQAMRDDLEEAAWREAMSLEVPIR